MIYSTQYFLHLESCPITYIPERLHSKDKPALPEFELGEFLYRRCKLESLEEPFDAIKLYDLSVNRQGNKDCPLSSEEDVLYNLQPDNGRGEKLDEKVITLEIKELTDNKTYEKTIQHQGLDGNGKSIIHTCFLQLLHDKLPCNYSHSIFRITFNGQIVTEQNYRNTLKKNSTSITELRNKCKIEFEQMIRDKEVYINHKKNS